MKCAHGREMGQECYCQKCFVTVEPDCPKSPHGRHEWMAYEWRCGDKKVPVATGMYMTVRDNQKLKAVICSYCLETKEL